MNERQLMYDHCPVCGLYTHVATGARELEHPFHLIATPMITERFCPDCLAEAKDIDFEDGCTLKEALLNLVPYTDKDKPEIVFAAEVAQREYDGISTDYLMFNALAPPTEEQLFDLLKPELSR